MDADLKKRWCEALRSGKYVQGRHILAEAGKDGTTRYCCMGVLDKLMGNDPLMNRSRTNIDPLNRDILPFADQKHLARMNDGSNFDDAKSFVDIADWIERNL